MAIRSFDFRSKLARAQGLGTAHHGVGHWWVQRVTAVALIPLSVWFMYSLVTAMLAPSVVTVALWFASPVHTALMVLMLIATFWHAKLGMQVVIEDYVHTPAMKYFLLLANMFFCVALGAVSILAVLKLHLLDSGVIG
jgi:succinate dehydrogenase / fumarate reductase, membrane anchor subunit